MTGERGRPAGLGMWWGRSVFRKSSRRQRGGDRPKEMRLEETSVEAKAGSEAGYICGRGEGKQVSWRWFQ